MRRAYAVAVAVLLGAVPGCGNGAEPAAGEAYCDAAQDTIDHLALFFENDALADDDLVASAHATLRRLERTAELAPDEVAGDVRTLERALTRYAEALEGTGGDPGAVTDVAAEVFDRGYVDATESFELHLVEACDA